MKHYLIDTNVVIDVLTDRVGSEEACAILDGAEQGKYILHLCSLRTDNLVRRLLGMPQRDGSDHGGYNKGHILFPHSLPITK